MSKRVGKRTLSKAAKRQDIMRAAERLFAGRRYHEVTLDEVAHVAGVGKGTIYLHFKDKEDLFFRLVTSGFDELCEVLKERLPAGAGFREQLSAAARETTRFFDARRPLVPVRIVHDVYGTLPGTAGERVLGIQIEADEHLIVGTPPGVPGRRSDELPFLKVPLR